MVGGKSRQPRRISHDGYKSSSYRHEGARGYKRTFPCVRGGVQEGHPMNRIYLCYINSTYVFPLIWLWAGRVQRSQYSWWGTSPGWIPICYQNFRLYSIRQIKYWAWWNLWVPQGVPTSTLWAHQAGKKGLRGCPNRTKSFESSTRWQGKVNLLCCDWWLPATIQFDLFSSTRTTPRDWWSCQIRVCSER